MLELARQLDTPGARWVAPAAEGGSWYPDRFMAPIASNEPFLSRAIDQCERAVDEASDNGRIDRARMAMVGFSQGACLASELTLRNPGRCGALIMFTGGLIGPPGTRWNVSGSDSRPLSGLRVLLTGSDVDEWVPEARVRETAEVLTHLGADVTLRIYPSRPHIVSEDEIVEARMFLNEILTTNPLS
jgi:predicted esterase